MSNSPNIHQSVRHRIARRIKRFRSNKGFTQEKLAQLAGLAPRHLQKIEAAQINITVDSLVKIASALGIDVSQLFTEDRDPES